MLGGKEKKSVEKINKELEELGIDDKDSTEQRFDYDSDAEKENGEVEKEVIEEVENDGEEALLYCL